MSGLLLASSCQPVAGEADCGDLVACVPARPRADGAEPAARWLVVIDGLGHGPLAAQAARRALATLEAAARSGVADADPPAMLRRMDAALIDGRGAAVGLVWLQDGWLRHAGIGNTRVLRWRDGSTLRLPSRYGIVGDGSFVSDRSAQGLLQADVDVQPGDWLLLFTDGLDERLQLPLMLPEWQADPARLCAHLMSTWRHPRDDAGVLACRVLP